MTQAEPLVLFLHIPKTAGTTLRHIIERQYPPDAILIQNQPTLHQALQALPPGKADRVSVVMGHLWFGAHALFARPATYLTMLRDPIDRIISHYYFVQRDPQHYLHDVVRGMSLEEYVTSNCSAEISNDQTRLLAGSAPAEIGQPSEDILATAKQNLDRHFAVVGLTEEFDWSVILMKRRFGWRSPFYLKRNVTRHPTKAKLSSETVRLIEQRNQLDLAVYRYAQARFREQVEAQGTSFEQEVRQFKILNGSYGKLQDFMILAAKKMRRKHARQS
jgi:hypothetical protein